MDEDKLFALLKEIKASLGTEEILARLDRIEAAQVLGFERVRADTLAIGADVAVLVVRTSSASERIGLLEARFANRRLEKIEARLSRLEDEAA